MKIALLLLLALNAAIPSSAAEAQVPPPMRSEAFISPIKRVYAVQDGVRRAVAYVVVWHEQEVIALPITLVLEKDDFAVGDSVRCLKHEVLSAPGSQPRMMFLVIGLAKISNLSPTSAAYEAGRQDFEMEIARRRVLLDGPASDLK